MYKCAKCNKEVIVNNVPEPIRACNCTREITDSFGNKIITPEKIIMDMNGHATGIANARI